jgi:hypothetical protein
MESIVLKDLDLQGDIQGWPGYEFTLPDED